MVDEALLNTYYAQYAAKRQSKIVEAKHFKKPFVLTEDFIDQTIEFIKKDSSLSDEMVEALRRRIKSSDEFEQDAGEALLGDYEHTDWYLKDNYELRPYWDRYFNYLKTNNPQFSSPNNKLDSDTNNIVNLLGDPQTQSPFAVRGLVMGDVQSGKTGTYIGVICKAVDAGYRVIILLTGTTESLRRQTQSRVDNGFIGFDPVKGKYIGAGETKIRRALPRSLTSTASDYTGNNIDKNTSAKVERFDSTPLVFVCKKNTKVLTKIIGGLRRLNTDQLHSKIDAPLLLIDDEADNASINTSKPEDDPTRINDNIRTLLSLFKQSSYVGFTATPFANVFITPEKDKLGNDDLFPKDFIYTLNAPSNYFGPMSVFGNHAKYKNCLVYLDDFEDNQDRFIYKHKKDWDGDKLFPSFYDAIITFCLTNVIKDLRALHGNPEFRGDLTSDRSMLINMSRFIDVQTKIEAIAKDFFKDILSSFKLFGQREGSEMKEPNVAEVYGVWKKQFEGKVEFEWKDIRRNFYDSNKSVKIMVVNSRSKSGIDYESHKDTGLRVIAVGGLALSRGLTLQGLIVSYFFRNTMTYDVLMQMGRWFGYHDRDADLIRIWITRLSAKWYGEIAEAIQLLRSDISRMIEKKKTPYQFGVRVRNDSDELGITAPNKMRNTLDRAEKRSYYGDVFENTYLSSDPDVAKKNWDAVNELCKVLINKDLSVPKPYYRNINKKFILDLLNSIEFGRVSPMFDKEQISHFINTENDPILNEWDVMLFDRSKDDDGASYDEEIFLQYTLSNGQVVHPIQRYLSVTSDGSIAVSGKNSRVGSKSDTSYGLTRIEKQSAEEAWKESQDKSPSNKTYLIEGRNPLLIVYFIIPRIGSLDQGSESYSESIRAFLSQTHPGQGLVAFSVAIPRKEGATNDESHLYKVNRDADYYVKEGYKDEDNESAEE